MASLLAALPIVVVLALMLGARWGGQRAAPAGWGAGVLVAAASFGLTSRVFLVSQAKGLLLSAYVLAVLWAALLLYNVVDAAGGIRAVAAALEARVARRETAWIICAWAFSGMLEGLAGFGLPVAIVAPVLAGLGVSPVVAVAAVAVGHSWAVTFGDMGIIWYTLLAVVRVDAAALAPTAALLLGLACLLCGLAAAALLGQARRVPLVAALSVVMGTVQYALVAVGVPAVAALGAGAAGVAAGIWMDRRPGASAGASPALAATIATYGVLIVVMVVTTIEPVRSVLGRVAWQATFPAVTTSTGFAVPAGTGQALRLFTHPASALLLVAVVAAAVFERRGLGPPRGLTRACAATWRAAAPATVSIVAMVGLATLMEHTGMTLRLARLASDWLGRAYPLASPLVGMLGAFATGSNNNSNVLFAPLQRDAATLLGVAVPLLVAAQTAGGALGSMIAPAKIVVGCATTGIAGQEGRVLRATMPYGIAIGLALGVVTLLLTR